MMCEMVFYLEPISIDFLMPVWLVFRLTFG